MKKLITKFTSIFLAVVVVSVMVVPPSVFAFSGDYIKSFPSPPLSVKSNFFKDDVLKYDYCLVRFSSNRYIFYFYNLSDIDSDISFLDIRKSGSYHYLYFGIDSSYHYFASIFYDSSGNYSNYSSSKSGTNLFSINNVDDFTDSIIYSDLPIKYNSNTIYDTSQNQAVSIENFYTFNPNSGGGSSSDVAGPPQLIIDYQDASLQGFANWLINNDKLTELRNYGISVTSSNLLEFLGKWNSPGASNGEKFLSLITSFHPSFTTSGNAKKLYDWVTKQWELYKRSLVSTTVKYPTLPDYKVEDEEGNFIDDTNSYLKMIYNAITIWAGNFSTVSGYIYDAVLNIQNYCWNIISYLYDLPSDIANAVYNNFVDPMNEIIDSVKNIKIDGSTSNTTNNNTNINIDIDNIDQTENNYNIAFGDLQLTLENKFEFYHQITNITDTIQNYTYSSEAPQLSMNVGSELGISDTEMKIDFSFFEPYRDMFRKIIVTVAYISFILTLMQKLPQIIGGI